MDTEGLKKYPIIIRNMEALSNYEIQDISTKKKLDITCLAQEELTKIKGLPTKNYIVLLNDNSNDGHWTCFTIRNNKAYYFDSFACPPSNQILKFLKKNNLKCVVNRNDIQQIDDTSCGWYCIIFIHYMKNSKKYPDKTMIDFGHLFFNNTNKNVEVLKKYIDENKLSLE